ncbi:MAG: hypothetical protein ACFFAE_09220 [Candidatus Hodarchaeota archaeon]
MARFNLRDSTLINQITVILTVMAFLIICLTIWWFLYIQRSMLWSGIYIDKVRIAQRRPNLEIFFDDEKNW